MSFLNREKSPCSGHPIELYRFAMGEKLWMFTSADHEVELSDEEKYQPVYIKRGGFIRGGDTRKATLDIEIMDSNPVAMLFRAGWLPQSMIVTVYRRHYEDNESVMLWKGRIINCKWAGSAATLTSEPAYTLFRRAGLRRVYQIGCPHALFGPDCRLDESTWAVSGNVAAIAGNTITVPMTSGFASGYFVAGMIKAGDEYRMITGHEDGQITLLDAVAGLTTGQTITLWPGCDRSTACCTARFNNLDNYGGLPFLPKKNPFSGDALV
jgi:uncharacterized phage protein (TIGR02218 family)